jgi:NADPH-dependent F420 reductase
VRIAILGGTGSFGRALAGRLASLAEDDVVLGSRDAERARFAADELGGGRISGATNVDAVRGADLVVLAVKADAALDTAFEVAEALDATPLLCVATAIEFRKGVGALPDPEARSLAERVQDTVRAPVAAGLHSIAASNLDEAPDEDALICGDDPRAKELALELAGKLVAGRALDAGPLASARALEGLTAVIVNLNRRYKAHAGVRVTGVPDQA